MDKPYWEVMIRYGCGNCKYPGATRTAQFSTQAAALAAVAENEDQDYIFEQDGNWYKYKAASIECISLYYVPEDEP